MTTHHEVILFANKPKLIDILRLKLDNLESGLCHRYPFSHGIF